MSNFFLDCTARAAFSAELKSFKESLLKNRGLTLKVVTTCLEACAILESESGKTKAEKVDYIFEYLI